MGKITLTNIAEELAHKSGLSKDAADNFMRAIVDTIEKGLREDNIVKIKGLGTFKLMEVSDRGSIDVNTGERITIKGYTKVTFTPDSAMKEFINRPFAHFEPTELNEGFQDEELVVGEEQATANIEEVEEAINTPLLVEETSEENTENTDNIQDAASQPAEEKIEETAIEPAIETVNTDTQEIPVLEEVAESENIDSTEIEAEENTESIEIETVDNAEETAAIEEEVVIAEVTEPEQTTEETSVAEKTSEEVLADSQPESTPNQDLLLDNQETAEEVSTTIAEPEAEERKSQKEETEETKIEEEKNEKPKSKRGRRGLGCLLSIFIVLAVIAFYYFVIVPTNEQEALSEQTEITVNPNLEKDLDQNWEETTQPTDNASTDSLPSHNESEPTPVENQEEVVSSDEDLKVDTEASEQKSTTEVATTITINSNNYSIVPITESLAAKSIKDITIADTTEYTIGATLTKHELKSGETIIQLARKYYGDKRLWPYIVKYNNITDFNKVAVGMTIEIPVLNSKN